MQTRSFRPHTSVDSGHVTASIQPRSWGDEQTNSPLPPPQNLAHVDLFSHAPQRGPIQLKLNVGAPNDQYEQEADRVAKEVMSMPATPAAPPVQRATDESVQRQEAEEEELQAKPLASAITPLVQREPQPEEEEALQAKSLSSTLQRESAEEEEVQAKSASEPGEQMGLEEQLSSSKGGGSPLPTEVRDFMEPRFGADFSQVRVHTGNEAVQMNQGLGAQAFAHGQDVYFGSGKSPANDDLTAHELTHVVQQGGAPMVQSRPAQPSAAHPGAGVQLRSQVPSIQRALNWTRNDLETGAGTKTFRSTEYKNIVRILHNYNAITNPGFDRVGGLQELRDACNDWIEKNKKQTSAKVQARLQVIQRLRTDVNQEIGALQGNVPANNVPGPANQAVPVNANNPVLVNANAPVNAPEGEDPLDFYANVPRDEGSELANGKIDDDIVEEVDRLDEEDGSEGTDFENGSSSNLPESFSAPENDPLLDNEKEENTSNSLLGKESESKASNLELAQENHSDYDSPAPLETIEYIAYSGHQYRGENPNLILKTPDDYFFGLYYLHLTPKEQDHEAPLVAKSTQIFKEFERYKALANQFEISGQTLEYFITRQSDLDSYISENILPHLVQFNQHIDEYLILLNQLEPNILFRAWNKLNANKNSIERTNRLKEMKEYLNDTKQKVPEEQAAIKRRIHFLVETKAKETQKRLQFKNKFKGNKQAIENAVNDLDPTIAAAIKKTNKGIQSGGKIKKIEAGNLSGAYLIPDGFFKPLSQAPRRESQGMTQGYQAIREVLAYEISKYIQRLFEKIGVKQDLGVVKTGVAALTSEKFAHGGVEWRSRQGDEKAVPEAAVMPEQIGIWQERIDIKNSYKDRSTEQRDDNSKKMQSQVQQVAFFDLMTGNYDRHGSNLVFDTDGNLRPVDQGEILPNFNLYKGHNSGTDHLAWSGMKAANEKFSGDFEALADLLDPDEVITFLKKEVVDKISQSMGIPELAQNAVSEESWQIMHLHILALKAGIKAELSPRELAEIFARGPKAELYQALTGLDAKREEQGQAGTELSPEEFEQAKLDVLNAIKNGKERLRPKQS